MRNMPNRTVGTKLLLGHPGQHRDSAVDFVEGEFPVCSIHQPDPTQELAPPRVGMKRK